MADMTVKTIRRRVVTITNPVTGEQIAQYNVARKTTEQKELIKHIKADGEQPAVVTVTLIEERRAMTLDAFIENSIIVTEEEAV